jgi:mRNA-degrading endonuclease toxin of MazEF toxin-antitoxin module
VRQGEVWARGDQPTLALIVSSDMYNSANTGRVIVCPVIPGGRLPNDDFAADVGISAPVTGTVLPELIGWMPASGLSAPLGALGAGDWQNVDQILRRVLDH